MSFFPIYWDAGQHKLPHFVFHRSTVEAFFLCVLWMIFELPDTFLLCLCYVPDTTLHHVFQLFCIFSIFRCSSCFLVLQVLGLVKEEGKRGRELPTYLIEIFPPGAEDLADSRWFVHFGGQWQPLQYQGCCYDPAPQVQDEWNLTNKYVSFISTFDSLFSSVSNVFIWSLLLYSF